MYPWSIYIYFLLQHICIYTLLIKQIKQSYVYIYDWDGDGERDTYDCICVFSFIERNIWIFCTHRDHQAAQTQVLLPLPWAIAARCCWHLTDSATLRDSFLQYEVRNQRKQIAEKLILDGIYVGFTQQKMGGSWDLKPLRRCLFVVPSGF